MSENLKLNLIVAIVDVLVTAMFTVLAIVFHKWWIIFFSILLTYTISDKKEEKE